jgi:hypothetical protein
VAGRKVTIGGPDPSGEVANAMIGQGPHALMELVADSSPGHWADEATAVILTVIHTTLFNPTEAHWLDAAPGLTCKDRLGVVSGTVTKRAVRL